MGLLIGLDGGGAKTAGALCDAEGQILARSRGAGSAIVGLPQEPFFATVQPILANLTEAAGVPLTRVERVVIGLSGVDYADEIEDQRRFISERLGLGDRLVLVNDGLVALWGVSPEDRVSLVQHGSGVTTAYRTGPGRETMFDSLDVAAVYDLRQAVVAATARMIDGRARPTPLRDAVLEHCGVTAEAFAEWSMRSPEARGRRSALAEVVFEAWRAGDPTANEMVGRAAHDYALTTAAMARRMGPDRFQAGFAGGLIQQGGPEFQTRIEAALRELCPQAQRIDPALPPDLGALVMAAWRPGRDLRAFFLRLAAREAEDGPA